MKYNGNTVRELGGNVQYNSDILLDRAKGVVEMPIARYIKRLNDMERTGAAIIAEEEAKIAKLAKKRRKGRR